ncbi:RNA recognition motif domain-containing protein [Deminuibacter soli]|uniref:RNA-binding protein n=1 Tax=Deminuibacter soli TaxID=2291815 RepID=A0A3E1NQD8_9BACT|nr:RNA-binding protein [Deminuibacter soli]RFM30142.1 RNA-binding protein [Deminuibacter soli]
MNIFIHNLNFHISQDDLKQLFSPFGEVVSSRIILDKETGKSRGFGFVEMLREEDGQTAITSLEGFNLEGRFISVTVARPKNKKGKNIF